MAYWHLLIQLNVLQHLVTLNETHARPSSLKYCKITHQFILCFTDTAFFSFSIFTSIFCPWRQVEKKNGAWLNTKISSLSYWSYPGCAVWQLRLYDADFNHLCWFTVAPGCVWHCSSQARDDLWHVNNTIQGRTPATFSTCRTPSIFCATYELQYLWETCVMKFIGPWFVVSYFISWKAGAVDWAMQKPPAGNIYIC